MKSVLSPRELADAIGVSESSLKRWADAGRLQVTKTAGGHRRITIAEAVRFIRETSSPVLRPDILGLPATAEESATADDLDERLYTLLRGGHAAEAQGLLLTLFLEGHGIATIVDGPLRGALDRIGALWRTDQNGIFIEHRATEICIQALRQLSPLLSVPQDAPIAVGGAGPADPSVLPSLAASLTLTSIGYRTINLGARTPLETLRIAAAEYEPRIVWLSLNHAAEADELRRELPLLAGEMTKRGTMLAVGGRSVHALALSRGGAVFVGDSMAELAAYARGLLGARDTS